VFHAWPDQKVVRTRIGQFCLEKTFVVFQGLANLSSLSI